MLVSASARSTRWRPGKKIFVESESGAVAFFRVELSGKNIFSSDGGSKEANVFSVPNSHKRVGRFTKITMHEIKSLIIVNILPQRMRARLHYRIPAHVRDFLRCLLRRESPHRSRKQSEPGRIALLGTFEEHLHSDAYTKERLALCSAAHRSFETAFGQIAHAIRHCALPGEYHPICIEHLLRRAADADVDIREVLTRNELKGLGH